MEFIERRREQRILCALGVGEINGRSCPDTYLIDISSIGAQLETGHSLEIGEPVEFNLSPPAETPEEKAYRFAGQVVWKKESEPDLNRYRIGLSFFVPFKETTKVLEKFRYRLI